MNEKEQKINIEKSKEVYGRICKCGFEFSGPGQFRNAEVFLNEHNEYFIVCPDCGRTYPSD